LPRAKAIVVIAIEDATIATAMAVTDLAEVAVVIEATVAVARLALLSATNAVSEVILRAIVAQDVTVTDEVAIEIVVVIVHAIAVVIVRAIVAVIVIVDVIARVTVRVTRVATRAVTRVEIVVVTRVVIVRVTKVAIRVAIEITKKDTETEVRTKKNVTGNCFYFRLTLIYY
jgi:hypothetical protein